MMLQLFVRDLPHTLVIPEGEAMRCLDCQVIYRLARVCPCCARDSGALVEGSEWARRYEKRWDR